MKHYGYARVSSEDQSLDIQIAELQAAGCDVVLSEKVSGAERREEARADAAGLPTAPGEYPALDARHRRRVAEILARTAQPGEGRREAPRSRKPWQSQWKRKLNGQTVRRQCRE